MELKPQSQVRLVVDGQVVVCTAKELADALCELFTSTDDIDTPQGLEQTLLNFHPCEHPVPHTLERRKTREERVLGVFNEIPKQGTILTRDLAFILKAKAEDPLLFSKGTMAYYLGLLKKAGFVSRSVGKCRRLVLVPSDADMARLRQTLADESKRRKERLERDNNECK